MTSEDQHPDVAALGAGAAAPNAEAGAEAAAEGAATPASTSPTPAARAPLTSLSSLLGGEFEGGTVCAADGTCD